MGLPPSLNEADVRAKPRQRILYGLLRVALALAISAFIFQINLDYFESYLYDLRMRIRPAPPASGHVELVFIDPATIEHLRAQPGFGEHAEFLKKMAAAGPRALLYDFPLKDVPLLKGSDASKQDFIHAAEALPPLRFLTEELEMKGEDGKLRLPAPFQNLPVASGPLSADTKNFAKDGVTRRFLIEYQNSRPVHIAVAGDFNPDVLDKEKIRGRFSFLGTDQAYINFRPPNSYPRSSFIDVLQGKVPLERFRDRIVILGSDTQVDDRDYALTPYARNSVGMTSAEKHANIIDTLIRNDSPVRSGPWVDFILIALISILTVNIVFLVKPTRGLLILGATLTVFCGLAGFAFWPFGFWVTMSQPLLAVFLCYYFFIPYRLIIESRRSWEIYQKHRLLQHVEELKTNFISMMSHDLKTPIARILGMVDLIQRDPTPLSTPQREALDTVRASSDDLLKFINSILQYGRIEAEQIRLHLQSKDVNQLLKDVVKKHEFLAKLKRIHITTELDTLFPSPVDPELMKQVFSNLVENAIKYSPEGTKVLISSEEKDGRIVIQVADQGPGIPTDELPNIFMKFFRSKNAKSSPVKGSGLGLYLAKYFTELHGGRISVESSYGQGSTFTVELPLDGAAP